MCKSNWKRLTLITGIITGSLSLFVVISLFVFNVEKELQAEVKPLVGADIVIEGSQPISEQLMQDLYDLALTEEIQIMKQIEFTTNIQTQSAEPKLIKVQGVQEGYPFYGDLELDTTIQTYSSGVWVDAQTYTQYVEGGVLRIGEKSFDVAGIITSLPVTSVSLFDEGRTILMPHDAVINTQLTEIGSRIEYEVLIKTATDDAIPGLVEKISALPSVAGIYEVENAASRIGQVNRITDEFERFITIALIITFILVASTIFISVKTFFAREQRNIGVLKLLGQNNRDTLLLYTSMFACCFVVGWLLSGIFGRGAIQWIRTFEISQGFVFNFQAFWKSGAISVLLGIISLSLPLLYIFSQDPLKLLAPQRLGMTPGVIWIQLSISMVCMFFMYLISIQDVLGALVFVGIIGCTLLLLSLYITNFLRLITRFFARYTTTYFLWFDGVRASIAPGNQSLLMSIGLLVSVTCLLVISGVSQNFLKQLRSIQTDQSNLFVLNILPEDIPWIQDSFPDAEVYDTILGRITSINDIPLLDRTKQKGFNRSGEFTREFNITTKLFSLDVYISGGVPGTGEVSLEKDFAERLGIGMGDTIRFFIQGRNFDLRVTSFRVAQRNGLTPFFYMQFPQDQFSGAPKTYFWLANVTGDEKTIFKRSIVENLGPHVSFVDTADIAETITDISSKITLVIQVLLYFLLVFVAISIYVCLESMKVLKELKIQLYQYLGATDGMMKTTLRAELGSIFGIAILTAGIAASSILSFIFSSSDLLMWSSDVILYTLFLIVCVTVAIILLIRLVYNRLIY